VVTTYANIYIHLPDLYIYDIIIFSCHVFVRTNQGMSHLHALMGVAGPPIFFIFVAGPFLKVIE